MRVFGGERYGENESTRDRVRLFFCTIYRKRSAPEMHPTQKKPLDLYQALEGKRESHTLRLPPEASELLKAHALSWGVSRADVVAWCVCTALAPQTKTAKPSEEPAQPSLSGWADVMGRFEQAVVRFEQAILSGVSASYTTPRSTSAKEEPSEASQQAEASERIEAPQHTEALSQPEASQRAKPSDESLVASKPMKARNTEASAPKEPTFRRGHSRR